MKFGFVSDIHGLLPRLDAVPEVDVLLIAGDTCPVNNHHIHYQRDWLEGPYSDWVRSIRSKVPYVIRVPGNHDFVDEEYVGEAAPVTAGVTMIDSFISLEGVGIYGTPWSNRFGGWAFMAGERDLKKRWAKIPSQTDILVVHGPPYRHGDKTHDGLLVGSTTLLERIKELQIKYVVTGHIHEARGHYIIDRNDGGVTDVFNVAWCDVAYTPNGRIQVVEL